MFGKKLGTYREKKPLSLRLYNRIMHKYNSHDLNYELQAIARQESAAYVKSHMKAANMYANRWHLLEAALADATKPGLYLEFGVEKGDSVNFLARMMREKGLAQPIHAFDSFEGLPEAWTGTFERSGKFTRRGKIPPLLPNVAVHKGWFTETIAEFVKTTQDEIALIHIDCDLYSSTVDILDGLGDRLKPGTVVIFDEYFNYHNWQEHEYRAWQEFVAKRGIKYTYRGFTARYGHLYLTID